MTMLARLRPVRLTLRQSTSASSPSPVIALPSSRPPERYFQGSILNFTEAEPTLQRLSLARHPRLPHPLPPSSPSPLDPTRSPTSCPPLEAVMPTFDTPTSLPVPPDPIRTAPPRVR